MWGAPGRFESWERSGAEPTPQEIALWDERLYGQGYKPQQFGIEAQRSGVSPAPPIGVPIVNTYITPRKVWGGFELLVSNRPFPLGATWSY
jgi:hypothetical protein